MLAIVCPGQGSQTPGFLAPWLELDGTRDLLASLSDAAGVDLIRHGTESDEETIKDTETHTEELRKEQIDTDGVDGLKK